MNKKEKELFKKFINNEGQANGSFNIEARTLPYNIKCNLGIFVNNGKIENVKLLGE
jgi:hypothetical protein